jgi:hypothetical protein
MTTKLEQKAKLVLARKPAEPANVGNILTRIA